jgi:hypothetical protein
MGKRCNIDTDSDTDTLHDFLTAQNCCYLYENTKNK